MVGSSRARIIVAAATCVALLVSAVSLGLRVPELGLLSGFPAAGSIDYSAGPAGGFTPLEPSALRRLGADFSQPVPEHLATIIRGPVIEPPPLDAGDHPVSVSHAFSNDDFKNAYPAPSIPFTARTNTSYATRETGEPTSCGTLERGTAWYRYTSPNNLGLIADTLGSSYGTTLTVYTGSSLRDLKSVGCSSDTSGNALVAFAAKRNVTYYFQIAGTIGGDLVFSLNRQGLTELMLPNGMQTDGENFTPVISADGNNLIFTSASRHMTGQESIKSCFPDAVDVFIPCLPQSFIMNIRSRKTIRSDELQKAQSPTFISTSGPPFSYSAGSQISADGRYAVFVTAAALVPEDTNNQFDVYRRDLRTGEIEWVSVPCAGCVGASGPSAWGNVSGDGRFISFSSSASNLVPGDTNGVPDVFVRDMKTKVTTRESVASDGTQANNDTSIYFPGEQGSADLSISDDGRYVAFLSTASNLVPGDTNHATNAFVRDRVLHRTIRVNVPNDSSLGDESTGGETPSPTGLGVRAITDDGRYAFFLSTATNLVHNVTTPGEHLYRRDIVGGTTTMVDVSSTGIQADQGAGTPVHHSLLQAYLGGTGAGFLPSNNSAHSFCASPDGRYIVFSSDAANLVPGDSNKSTDVFLRDLTLGLTTRVSVATDGREGNDESNSPTISYDGRTIAFYSMSTNLAPGGKSGVANIFLRHLPPHGG